MIFQFRSHESFRLSLLRGCSERISEGKRKMINPYFSFVDRVETLFQERKSTFWGNVSFVSFVIAIVLMMILGRIISFAFSCQAVALEPNIANFLSLLSNFFLFLGSIFAVAVLLAFPSFRNLLGRERGEMIYVALGKLLVDADFVAEASNPQ